MIWGLIGIAIAGAILIGSIMGLTSHGRIQRLEQQVSELRRRLDAAGLLPDESRSALREAAMRRTRDDRSQDIVSSRKTPEPKAVEPKAAEFKPVKAAALATPKAPVKAKPIKSKRKPPSRARRSFEEELGARWAVWVGGFALLLGAVFLLRYSIEAGFFSPAMRVGMAAVMGAVMLAGGEYLRRHDIKFTLETELTKSLSENAYIPGILTAVGIFALLGAVYAAYALYSFVSPEFAFVLLGIISLGAMALGLIHGPKLAALGLVAALATPLLVQTEVPKAYLLFGYLTIVSLAALALAKKRHWGWLNLAALFGGLLWLYIALDATRETGSYIVWLGFMALAFAASTYIAATSKPAEKPSATFVHDSMAASLWAAGAAFALLLAYSVNGFAWVHYRAGLVAVAILLGVAWLRPRQSAHILTAAGLGAALLMIAGNHGQSWQTGIVTASILSVVIALMAHSRLSLTFNKLKDDDRDLLWAGFGAAFPIVLMCMIDLLHTPIGATLMGLLLLGAAVLNAGLAYRIWHYDRERTLAISIYAIGAAIAFTLAVMIGFSGMGQSLGLMLGIVLAALAAWKMPIVINRVITVGFAGLTAAHVILLQIPLANSVSDVFIFNQLWIYLALPAVISAGAAWIVSRVKDDIWSEGLKAFALSFAALFVIFQIRHAMNGGDVLAERFSLDELALQVLVGLSFTLGGALLGYRRSPDKKPSGHEALIPNLAMGVSLVTLLAFAAGLCLFKAPLLNGASHISGNALFNSLILAYLLPAILLGGIAGLSQKSRPKAYVRAVAGLSLLAVMFYVTSMIRRMFTGPEISIFKNFPDGIELYAISAIWLLLGIGLLALGLKTKRQDIRMASAGIITLTVLKAFLIDMAGLEGVLRALSFVVLGLVLIVIGRVYQRLLFSQKAKSRSD